MNALGGVNMTSEQHELLHLDQLEGLMRRL